MLQGVLRRGTATRIAALAPYVAGKTGTTDGENDAWFVGFTNEVTVAVWVGYDNADGRRRTLGGGATGGSVAVPIFEPVIQAVWAHHSPRTILRGPTPETRRYIVAQRTEAEPGDTTADGTLVEYLRRDASGQAVICLRSTYRLEGRLPVGIQLANKLREGSRRISDTLEFDSELTVLSAAEVGELGLAKLTLIDTRRLARSSRTSFTSTR